MLVICVLEQEKVLLIWINSSTYEGKHQNFVFTIRPYKYQGRIMKLSLMGTQEYLNILVNLENRKQLEDKRIIVYLVLMLMLVIIIIANIYWLLSLSRWQY